MDPDGRLTSSTRTYATWSGRWWTVGSRSGRRGRGFKSRQPDSKLQFRWSAWPHVMWPCIAARGPYQGPNPGNWPPGPADYNAVTSTFTAGWCGLQCLLFGRCEEVTNSREANHGEPSDRRSTAHCCFAGAAPRPDPRVSSHLPWTRRAAYRGPHRERTGQIPFCHRRPLRPGLIGRTPAQSAWHRIAQRIRPRCDWPRAASSDREVRGFGAWRRPRTLTMWARSSPRGCGPVIVSGSCPRRAFPADNRSPLRSSSWPVGACRSRSVNTPLTSGATWPVGTKTASTTSTTPSGTQASVP